LFLVIVANAFQKTGWNELATTNAPVEDEVVEVVLGMNQNHILLAQIYIFFLASTLPQNIFLVPTFLPPTSYLLSTSPLLPTPSYLPPTSPLLPLVAIARAKAGALEPKCRSGSNNAKAGARAPESERER